MRSVRSSRSGAQKQARSSAEEHSGKADQLATDKFFLAGSGAWRAAVDSIHLSFFVMLRLPCESRADAAPTGKRKLNQKYAGNSVAVVATVSQQGHGFK